MVEPLAEKLGVSGLALVSSPSWSLEWISSTFFKPLRDSELAEKLEQNLGTLTHVNYP